MFRGSAVAQSPERPRVKIRFRNSKGGAFYRAIVARAYEYFRTSGKSRYADWTIWAKAAVYFALTAGAYGLILSGRFGEGAMRGAERVRRREAVDAEHFPAAFGQLIGGCASHRAQADDYRVVFIHGRL